MKGITPVIAIILLLLITISMVGFAFVWFSRVSTTITNQTETAIVTQQQQMAKKVSIDSASTTQLSIRNVGSATISTTEIAVYVAGSRITPTWSSNSVAPGAVIYTTGNYACTAGQKVRVTAPGSVDETTC
ncbi:MAG: archaellin/type IV pilin N-terminal domain-containing protein [Candidatus Aenigmatarchaeota archaeon]